MNWSVMFQWMHTICAIQIGMLAFISLYSVFRDLDHSVYPWKAWWVTVSSCYRVLERGTPIIYSLISQPNSLPPSAISKTNGHGLFSGAQCFVVWFSCMTSSSSIHFLQWYNISFYGFSRVSMNTKYYLYNQSISWQESSLIA